MRRLLFLLSLLIITGCGPSEAEIAAAIAETDAARPSETSEPDATPAPTEEKLIARSDIENILITPGDLPPGFSGSQLRDSSTLEVNFPNVTLVVFQQLEFNGKDGGGITVFYFSEQEEADKAYFPILESFGNYKSLESRKLDDLGERGYVLKLNKIPGYSTPTGKLVFTRCGAAIAVIFIGTDEFDALISYAKRLDQRIAPILCK